MHFYSKHNEQRRTHSLHIAYYVKADFVQQFTGDLSTLEQEIEESFVDSLRVECFNERKTSQFHFDRKLVMLQLMNLFVVNRGKFYVEVKDKQRYGRV